MDALSDTAGQQKPAHDRLIDAGIDLLVTDGLSVLQRGLTAGAITSRANLSERTFYTLFPSKKDYITALLESLWSPDLIREAPNFASSIEGAFAESGRNPLVVIRGLCDAHLKRLRDIQTIPVQFAISSLGHGDTVVATGLRSHYDSVAKELRDSYQTVLDHWGVDIRAPLTFDSIATILMALSEGLLLRSLVDPDAVPPTILSDAIVALLPGTIDTDRSGKGVESLVGDLGIVADSAKGQSRLVDINLDLRQRILSIGDRKLGDSSGLAAFRLEQIAADADEPLMNVQRLFATSFHLVAAIARPMRTSLAESVDGDDSLGFAPLAVIERHFARLSALLVRMPALAEAVVLSVVRNNGEADRIANKLDFSGVIRPMFEKAAAESGSGEPDVQLAETITHMLALRACAVGDESDMESFGWLVHTMLGKSRPD